MACVTASDAHFSCEKVTFLGRQSGAPFHFLQALQLPVHSDSNLLPHLAEEETDRERVRHPQA